MSQWKSLNDLREEVADALKDIEREQAQAYLNRTRLQRSLRVLFKRDFPEFIIDPQTLLPRLRRKWE